MLKFLSLFSGKNKKNKKMAALSELSLEELQERLSPMDFQWVKGDLTSTMEKYKTMSFDGENKFILFLSGRRINVDLLEEFMVYYPAQPDPVQAPRPNPGPKNSSVTSVVLESPRQSTISEDSPIYKLLKKQKSNPVEVAIKLKLNLPSKELYTVLSSSFEDAEREIIDFVLDGVDIEDIKMALAKSIRGNYLNNSQKEKQPSNINSVVKKKIESNNESEGE